MNVVLTSAVPDVIGLLYTVRGETGVRALFARGDHHAEQQEPKDEARHVVAEEVLQSGVSAAFASSPRKGAPDCFVPRRARRKHLS